LAFEPADQLAVTIYKATASFPREQQFGSTPQLRRAAVSIASNIVESGARFSESGYIRFLEIPYVSSREVEYQIGLSHHLGFLDAPSHNDLFQLATETAKMLNGLSPEKKPTASASSSPARPGSKPHPGSLRAK
jgi:four helix bundle protein